MTLSSGSTLAYYWPPIMPVILSVELAVQRMLLAVARAILYSRFDVAEVAERCGKSVRWVRARLASNDLNIRDMARIAYGAGTRLHITTRSGTAP